MSSTRPSGDSAGVEMKTQLTETSATLTFVNPEIKGKDEKYPSGDYAHYGANTQGLSATQAKIHPGISEPNFVRSFSDPNNNKPGMKTILHTEFDSAFGSMAHYAFGQHKTIVLRPDDIHLLVVQGIARFLQRYPEDFRQAVVSFSGKQKVKIYMPGINDAKDWHQLPLGFAGMIRQLINSSEVADLLLQDYSQSTAMDKTVKAVTLMGTFSAYFNYTASTMCHIPQFILEGTVEDWLKIDSLVGQLIALLNLKESKNEDGPSLMHRWLTRLEPILHNMYLARTGTADGLFWQNFYKYKSQSGGDYITGNIVYFYPFLKRPHFRKDLEDIRLNEWIMGAEITLGQYDKYHCFKGPRTDELTANFIEVDFVLEHLEDNQPQLFEMGMKAGIIAYQESADNKLSSHVDFSIFFKKNRPKDFTLNNGSSASQESAKAAAATTTQSSSTTSSSAPNIFKKKIQFELVLDGEESAPANTLKK